MPPTASVAGCCRACVAVLPRSPWHPSPSLMLLLSRHPVALLYACSVGMWHHALDTYASKSCLSCSLVMWCARSCTVPPAGSPCHAPRWLAPRLCVSVVFVRALRPRRWLFAGRWHCACVIVWSPAPFPTAHGNCCHLLVGLGLVTQGCPARCKTSKAASLWCFENEFKQRLDAAHNRTPGASFLCSWMH